MLNELGGIVGLQLASSFASGSTPNGPSAPHLLLNQYIPGFGLIHDLVQNWTGIDITSAAARIATLFGVYAVTRFIGQQTYDFLLRYATSAITIPAHDVLNKEVLSWMSTHIVAKRGSRHLSAQTVRSGDDAIIDPYRHMAMGYAATMQENATNNRSSSVRFYPAVGVHYFFFQGRPFVFERGGKQSGAREDYESAVGQDPIIIRCFGRSPEPLKRFLSTCKEFGRDAREAMTVVCTADEKSPNRWGRMITRPSRPLKTVDMDENMKSSLIKDIESYLDPSTRRFYSNRGIPYRRGYLFHGAPGTGKTSLSFALAGHFKLNLYIMSLASPKLDDSTLDAMFGMLPPQCIVLMEDIDSARIERSTKETEEATSENRPKKRSRPNHGPVTLSGLLNAIDGTASQEGRVLIMTSNSPEELDDALLRPGRIDKQLCFPASSSAMAARLFSRMFTKDEADISPLVTEPGSDAQEIKVIEPALVTQMAEQFAAKIPDEKLTPAEVQGFLIDYRASPEDAIANVDAWVQLILEAKEKGTAVLHHFKLKPATGLGSGTPSESDAMDNRMVPNPMADIYGMDHPMVSKYQHMLESTPPVFMDIMEADE